MADDIREQAKQDYMNGMKYNDLAEKYNVTINTIKSWKQRYKWDRKSVHTKVEKCAHKKDKDSIVIDIEATDLTDKQKLFCIYYIKYFNATKAYRKAYGCSYETALTNGPALLGNTRIQSQIINLKTDKFKGAMLEPGDVLQKYIDIAFSDIADYLTFGQREEQVMGLYGPVFTGKGKNKKPVMHTVNYVDLNESIELDGTIISEVKQGRDGISLKMSDKMKALDWLANHMDLLDTATKEKLNIEREKLALEKSKANLPGDEDEETGVVILPEIDYTLQEGGGSDEQSGNTEK